MKKNKSWFSVTFEWNSLIKDLIRNVWIGVLSAVIADTCLIGMAMLLVKYEPQLIEIITPQTMLIVMGSVFVFGVVITWLCAYISMNKYLRMKANTLYYI